MPIHWIAFGVVVVGLLSLAFDPLFKAHLAGAALILASVVAAFCVLAIIIALGFQDTRAFFIKWLAVEAAIAAAFRLAMQFYLNIGAGRG